MQALCVSRCFTKQYAASEAAGEGDGPLSGLLPLATATVVVVVAVVAIVIVAVVIVVPRIAVVLLR